MLTTSKIDSAAFRSAMSRFAASVSVVTTDGKAGRRGLTVSAACGVSDDPATLLVCLNRASALNERFMKNGVFALNLLSTHHTELAGAFAGEGQLSAEERFALGEWDMLTTGAPCLRDAVASFDCRIVDSSEVATHRILFGEVADLRMSGEASSLVYRDRRYLSL